MYRQLTVKGRTPTLKSTIWTRRKKYTFNQKRTKKQEFKNRRGLGTSWTALNIPTSESYGCQKEKRKNKKLKLT